MTVSMEAPRSGQAGF